MVVGALLAMAVCCCNQQECFDYSNRLNAVTSLCADTDDHDGCASYVCMRVCMNGD